MCVCCTQNAVSGLFHRQPGTERKEQMRLYQLYRLTLHDLRMSSAVRGTGILWSIAEPVLLTGTLWAVMHLLVQAPPEGAIPYSFWFTAGYLPWQFFQRSVSESANVLRKHAYLLRQAQPPVRLLPLLPVCSSLLIHLLLLLLLGGILERTQTAVSPDLLLLTRVVADLILFTTGISAALSVLSVLVPWVKGLTGTLLQIWFWVTPVAWRMGRPDFVRINPLCGIVAGYRRALLAADGGAEVPEGVCLAVFAAGILCFERYRGEIADAL